MIPFQNNSDIFKFDYHLIEKNLVTLADETND